jgi:hypothetical protein
MFGIVISSYGEVAKILENVRQNAVKKELGGLFHDNTVVLKNLSEPLFTQPAAFKLFSASPN